MLLIVQCDSGNINGPLAECAICCSHDWGFNSLPTECRLLITFAKGLDPGQARLNVGPDLDLICLTRRWYSKNFSKKLILKNQQRTKNRVKFPRGQRVGIKGLVFLL